MIGSSIASEHVVKYLDMKRYGERDRVKLFN